jgi:hypothetical protein
MVNEKQSAQLAIAYGTATLHVQACTCSPDLFVEHRLIIPHEGSATRDINDGLGMSEKTTTEVRAKHKKGKIETTSDFVQFS